MKQARILIQSGQLLQQAYPWDVLSGQLPPNQFASRLKSLETTLSQFSSSLPYPNLTQNNKQRRPPFIAILSATLLTFIVLLFARHGVNTTLLWALGGAFILGTASYFGVSKTIECLKWRKMLKAIDSQLSDYNKHDNPIGITWKLTREGNKDYILIQHTQNYYSIRKPVSEKNELSWSQRYNGANTDEKRVTLVYKPVNVQ